MFLSGEVRRGMITTEEAPFYLFSAAFRRPLIVFASIESFPPRFFLDVNVFLLVGS